MKLDKEIIKYFKKWQQETGSCPEIDVDFVDFEFRKFGDFVRTEKGSTPKYSDTPTSCYVIKSGMARGGNNQFKLDKSFYLDLGKTSNPKYLKRGDLLLNTTGKGTAGRVTLFDLEGYYVSDSHITKFSLNPSEDSSLYFLYFLISYGFKNLEDMAEGTGGQVELNPDKIKNLEIIMPLNTERLFFQQKVIEFIQYYKAKFDAYRQLTSELRSRIEYFDKAFLPAIFSSKKEPFIVEKFNSWAEGRGYGLKFDEIEFSVGKIVGDPIHDNIICEKRMGFTPQTSEDGVVPWFTVGDLGSVNGLYINEPVTKNKTSINLIKEKVDVRGTGKSEKLMPIKKGDVLVSFKLTVGVAKVYNSELDSYCNEAIDILTPKAGYFSSYLAYNCMIEYPKRGMKTNNGYTLNDDSKSKIELLIPNKIENLSSFEIQEIIVEFIEHWQDWKAEIFKRIDELESNVNLTEETLIAKVFKGAEE